LIAAGWLANVDGTSPNDGGDDMNDIGEFPYVNLRNAGRAAQIAAALAAHGVAIFHGARSREDLLRVARSLITLRAHRDSDNDGITTICRRPMVAAGGSLAGFADGELAPHTEGSAVPRPPRILILCCARTAATGGGVRLADGRELHRDIAEVDTCMLEALSAPRSAYFGGAAGHVGAVFEPVARDRIAIRLRLDKAVRFSPVAAPFTERLRRMVEHRTFQFDLMAGSGYIVLNDRWLHGRTPFTGNRVMMRIIGDPLVRRNLLPGFITDSRTPWAPIAGGIRAS
jgi:hypothetical protein